MYKVDKAVVIMAMTSDGKNMESKGGRWQAAGGKIS